MLYSIHDSERNPHNVPTVDASIHLCRCTTGVAGALGLRSVSSKFDVVTDDFPTINCRTKAVGLKHDVISVYNAYKSTLT